MTLSCLKYEHLSLAHLCMTSSSRCTVLLSLFACTVQAGRVRLPNLLETCQLLLPYDQKQGAQLLQAEHAEALKQEQSSLAAFKSSSQAELKAAHAQLEELKTALRAAQTADRQSSEALTDLQAVNSKLQVTCLTPPSLMQV